MQEVRGWIAIIKKGLQYLAYRCGLATIPRPFDHMYPEGCLFFRRIYRWPKYMRVLGGDRLPPQAPAMFVANHIRFDDPITMFLAIAEATNYTYFSRFMMRTGAFGRGSILKSWILDLDELASLVAAIQIDRENISLKQLKPFVQRLTEGNALAMYIGRTRSRSGLLMEYLDFDEPGAPSFLIAQAQRQRGGEPLPAIPLTRTFDPLTKRSVFIFGEPRYLEGKPTREAQRKLDLDLIGDLANLVEFNMGHIIAGLLYNHCLTGGHALVDNSKLRRAAQEVANALENFYREPGMVTDFDQRYEEMIRILEKKNLVTRHKGRIAIAKDHILRVPPLERGGYVRQNPIKFVVNQAIHNPTYCEAIQGHDLSAQ